jgi:sugar phosphate isomerase/epimerase
MPDTSEAGRSGARDAAERLKLSCGHNAFPLIPLELAIDLVAALGFEGLDLTLAPNNPHLRPDSVIEDMPQWTDRLLDRIARHRLAVADIVCLPATNFRTLAVNSPDAAERARSERYFTGMLDLASRLGAPGLTMLPGVDWPDEAHETSLDRAARELSRRAAEARTRGLRFSVEPHVGSVCQTPADAARLCEMATGLELTVDYSHFVVQGFDAASIEPLLKDARHVHVRGASRETLQTSFTRSAIDYGRTIDVLRSHAYEGFLAIEYLWIEWAHLNEVDVLSETVVMRDFLRAKLTAAPWEYPDPGGVREAPLRG